MNHYAFISAIEYVLPDKILTNETLAAEFPNWTAEKIFAKTGIKHRHIAAENECASDLAFKAAEKLLARVDRSKIDYLIYCTQSPDFLLPTTACILQDRLGLATNCGALDINLGCSGYIYGLGLAQALIEAGQAKEILFLTGDTYSKYINPLDNSVRALFGDAGTATLINMEYGVAELDGPFVYGTDGRGKNNLIVPTRGARQEFIPVPFLASDGDNKRTENDLYMNGPEIFSFTSLTVPTLITQLLEKGGDKVMSDIDLFVFHQANAFMLKHLQKKLAISNEKFVVDLEETGNTVSCSIPIALKNAMNAKRIKQNAAVMLVGFGVGYSWGGTVVRWRS
jgi:3-oxoacyl-[acyl-carrier-protein] synthase-3